MQTGKLNDNLVGIAFAKCDREGNGLIDKTDLVHVLEKLDIIPTPAFINHLYNEYRVPDKEFIEFDEFKRLISFLNPMVGRAITAAKKS